MRILPFRQLYIPLIMLWKFSLNILKPFIKLKIFISIWMFIFLIISEKNIIAEITEKNEFNSKKMPAVYWYAAVWTSSQRDYTCLNFWIVWTWFLSHELIPWLQKLCNLILEFITQSDFWRFELRKLNTIAKYGV